MLNKKKIKCKNNINLKQKIIVNKLMQINQFFIKINLFYLGMYSLGKQVLPIGEILFINYNNFRFVKNDFSDL